MKTSNKYSGRKLKKPDMKQVGHFTQIPNAFILNPYLRDPELRLLQYIMMHSEHRTITIKDCILYLGKTMPAISKSFEKLIALGILRITDANIEVLIPEEMKKYKLGYLEGKENNTIEVKKTLPSESEKALQEGKENLTIEVKKTLLPGKEIITTEVKKTYKIPLESIDSGNVTNPIILNNSRVLPAPATSGSAEQSHSNDNTKRKTAIELDSLECVTLPSARIPSGVPQTLHTPSGKEEKVDLSDTLPIVEKSELPIEVKTLPIVENSTITNIEPDIRYAEQLKTFTTSKYFLPENLYTVKDIYMYYAKQNPNRFMTILDFEKVLACYIKECFPLSKRFNISKCLLYKDDLKNDLKYIHQFRKDMQDHPKYFQDLLKKLESENTNENLFSVNKPPQVQNVVTYSPEDDCIDITAKTNKSTKDSPILRCNDKSDLGDLSETQGENFNDDFPGLPF